MADLSITTTNVAYVSGRKGSGLCGQAITIGQAIAYDSSDGKYYLADNDSATAARKGISGIALGSTVAADQLISFVSTGVVDIGATVTQGVVYAVSSTAGGICPIADLGSGDEVLIIGVGSATSERINLDLRDTGVSIP